MRRRFNREKKKKLTKRLNNETLSEIVTFSKPSNTAPQEPLFTVSTLAKPLSTVPLKLNQPETKTSSKFSYNADTQPLTESSSNGNVFTCEEIYKPSVSAKIFAPATYPKKKPVCYPLILEQDIKFRNKPYFEVLMFSRQSLEKFKEGFINSFLTGYHSVTMPPKWYGNDGTIHGICYKRKDLNFLERQGMHYKVKSWEGHYDWIPIVIDKRCPPYGWPVHDNICNYSSEDSASSEEDEISRFADYKLRFNEYGSSPFINVGFRRKKKGAIPYVYSEVFKQKCIEQTGGYDATKYINKHISVKAPSTYFFIPEIR